MSGNVIVISGPMFSGKTQALTDILNREKMVGNKVLLVKPDMKNNEYFFLDTDEDKDFNDTYIPPSVTENHINLLIKMFKKYQVIGFDQTQFFDSWIVDLIIRLRRLNKKIVVSGLELNYRGEPFGYVSNLMCIADSVLKINAICMQCGKPAIYTQRLLNRKPTAEGEEFQIETESYEARCYECFLYPYEIEEEAK